MDVDKKDTDAITVNEKIDLNHIFVKDYMPDDMSIQKFMDLMQTGVTQWRTLETYYRCAMMEVETKFRVLNEELSMQYDRNPIETIKTRIKSRESLVQKMRNRNITMSLDAVEENITDMAGIRVICSFPKDIEMLADCLLKQDDIVLLERKDYIAHPKPNGYRGLHLIVEVPIFLHSEKRMMKVEIQLRTIAMDFWASLEHKLRYKKEISPQLTQLIGKELLECSEKSNELDRKMQEIRTTIENG